MRKESNLYIYTEHLKQSVAQDPLKLYTVPTLILPVIKEIDNDVLEKTSH